MAAVQSPRVSAPGASARQETDPRTAQRCRSCAGPVLRECAHDDPMLRGERSGPGHHDQCAQAVLQAHLARRPGHQVGMDGGRVYAGQPGLALLQHGGAVCGGGGLVEGGAGPRPVQHPPRNAVHNQLLQSHADEASQWTDPYDTTDSAGAVPLSQAAHHPAADDDAELSGHSSKTSDDAADAECDWPAASDTAGVVRHDQQVHDQFIALETRSSGAHFAGEGPRQSVGTAAVVVSVSVIVEKVQ